MIIFFSSKFSSKDVIILLFQRLKRNKVLVLFDFLQSASRRNQDMVNMETAETADNDIGNEEDRIKEVWSHNLEEEFKNICRVVQVLQDDTR